MAFCTMCGTVHHNEDIHQCKPEEVPEKGKEISATGVKRDVVK
jgi:hypothetical protein